MFDEDMEDEALKRVLAQDTASDPTAIVQAWRQMQDDLRAAGPLARLLLSFRESATAALADLVMADPSDLRKIRSLQDEVRRFMAAVQLVHSHREEAEAVMDGQEITDRDNVFLETLERGEN